MPTPAKLPTMRSFYVPHDRVQVHNTEPTRTKQSMAAECDINNIMLRYKKTGMFDHFSKNRQEYLDLPLAEDFHEAMNMTLAAQASFEALPSDLRNRFHNDPHLFLQFCDNEDNTDEMIEMGILPPPAPPVRPAETETESTVETAETSAETPA